MRHLLILLLLISSFSFSQETQKVKPRKLAKITARKQILQLHNGAILVRLKTRKNSIAAMRKVKKFELANKIEAKQTERNQLIIHAFRNNFNFCKVYFFYSDYSTYIIDNQLDSIFFLNNNLELDPSITISEKSFFTAEFGTIEPDTTTYGTSHYFAEGKQQTTHYGGSEVTFSALIIKDNNLTQLKKTFPFYVREYKGLPFHRMVDKVILRMDYKLTAYYKKYN